MKKSIPEFPLCNINGGEFWMAQSPFVRFVGRAIIGTVAAIVLWSGILSGDAYAQTPATEHGAGQPSTDASPGTPRTAPLWSALPGGIPASSVQPQFSRQPAVQKKFSRKKLIWFTAAAVGGAVTVAYIMDHRQPSTSTGPSTGGYPYSQSCPPPRLLSGGGFYYPPCVFR